MKTLFVFAVLCGLAMADVSAWEIGATAGLGGLSLILFCGAILFVCCVLCICLICGLVVIGFVTSWVVFAIIKIIKKIRNSRQKSDTSDKPAISSSESSDDVDEEADLSGTTVQIQPSQETYAVNSSLGIHYTAYTQKPEDYITELQIFHTTKLDVTNEDLLNNTEGVERQQIAFIEVPEKSTNLDNVYQVWVAPNFGDYLVFTVVTYSSGDTKVGKSEVVKVILQ